MNANATTSETLNKAADLIEERGWRVGPGGWGYGGTPLCLEGGIIAALGFKGFGDVELRLDEFFTCPAYRAVSDYLGLDPSLTPAGTPVNPLYRFNDKKGRTQAEVIATLRAAALIEAAKENQWVEVSA